MNLRQRITKSEKVLPDAKSNQEESELDKIYSWLVENSEEYLECIRQLFRLQCRVGQHNSNWERWQEPYREQADVYANRIHELIKQHEGKVHG